MKPKDKIQHKIHGARYTVSDTHRDPAGNISVINENGCYQSVHANDVEVIEEAPNSHTDVLVAIGKEMAEDYKKNDHCTADPIFLVEQCKRIYGMDSEFEDGHEWLEADTGEYDQVDPRLAVVLERMWDNCAITSPHKGYMRASYIEQWEFVQPFFTQTAADRYIAGNAHNLTTPRVMVDSAYRNREWQAIRAHCEALAQMSDAPKCPTCEGRKTVTKTLTFECGSWRATVPCPDCDELAASKKLDAALAATEGDLPTWADVRGILRTPKGGDTA